MKRIRDLSKKKLLTIGIVAVSVILAVVVIFITINVCTFCFGDSCWPIGRDSATVYRPTAAETAKAEAKRNKAQVEALGKLTVPDYVTVNYINPSRARTEQKLKAIKNIVIHYTGNAGTTAAQNRNYFGQAETLVCSHFLVGLDGEIIQCIPLDEQSAASNQRNVDTISIEVCHPDKSGAFTVNTYLSLVKLTAWLCDNSPLDSDDLIRHHDITGKDCPKYFVDHPDKWEQFKQDVDDKSGHQY